MPRTEAKAILFRASETQQATKARLETRHYDRRDRIKYAFKMLSLSWLGAAVTLFIPLAHFILVPSFILLGIYLAISALRQLYIMDNASGKCPSCKEVIKIKLESKDQLPKWSYCPFCNKSVQIDYPPA